MRFDWPDPGHYPRLASGRERTVPTIERLDGSLEHWFSIGRNPVSSLVHARDLAHPEVETRVLYRHSRIRRCPFLLPDFLPMSVAIGAGYHRHDSQRGLVIPPLHRPWW
jgi:hypothetical protein